MTARQWVLANENKNGELDISLARLRQLPAARDHRTPSLESSRLEQRLLFLLLILLLLAPHLRHTTPLRTYPQPSCTTRHT